MELFLHGNSLGEKRLVEFDERMLYLEVSNEPSIVRTVAKKHGIVVTCDE